MNAVFKRRYVGLIILGITILTSLKTLASSPMVYSTRLSGEIVYRDFELQCSDRGYLYLVIEQDENKRVRARLQDMDIGANPYMMHYRYLANDELSQLKILPDEFGVSRLAQLPANNSTIEWVLKYLSQGHCALPGAIVKVSQPVTLFLFGINVVIGGPLVGQAPPVQVSGWRVGTDSNLIHFDSVLEFHVDYPMQLAPAS